MYLQTPNHRLELPEEMQTKLKGFQRRVWIVKLAEGLLAGLFGLLLSYLLVFALDRVWDTPAWLRLLMLVAGAAGLGILFPLKWHRWVWRTRQMEQVARILKHRFPRLGDQLLGIVELVHNELEQGRSEALCRAAIHQVDERFRDRDLRDAVPDPRHRRWAWCAGTLLTLVLAALLFVPAAGFNALARWLMPWQDTERYTFAQLDQLPDQLVVPYAEPFDVHLKLASDLRWAPAQGAARYGGQQPVPADLQAGGYEFQLPPQREPDRLSISVGDARRTTVVQPTTRPELTSLTAEARLPDYLQHDAGVRKDVRGGWVSFVKGSRVTFHARAMRELGEATLDGIEQPVDGQQFVTESIAVGESTEHRLAWQDRLGLSTKEPFTLSINAVDDAGPTIACSRLSREQVVLDEDILTFQVLADDDFGIHSIGMEWKGIEDPLHNPHPAVGEKIVSAGGPEKDAMEVTATFSAKREGVPPQSLEVRLFAVDYLPGRERVYSPTYVFHVLSPEEHAIWLTNQLRKWFRKAQDVYEKEQQLYHANRELRDLPADQLDRPETRRRIETQAAGERTNARRLDALTAAGNQLIQQAARNDQFNVATLEDWAKMLQSLQDIAERRMPSVADLLTEAATAPGQAPPGKPSEPPPEGTSEESPPQVGVNRDGRSGKPGKSKPGEPSKVPSISDVESGFNPLEEQEPKQDEAPPSSPGRLTLPGTAIVGGGPPKDEDEQADTCPAEEKMDEAVQEQEDLLAEFAKVAEELQRILSNLEGSTFVKRLKAASRRQLEVASELNDGLDSSFGLPERHVEPPDRKRAERIAEREIAQSDGVYVIQEDLEAFYHRVQMGKYKTVLQEMQDERVVTNLRTLADTVTENFGGQGIAEAEFWADALDRWAEQLVGPG